MNFPIQLVVAIIAAIAYGLSALLKTQPQESFDSMKFVETVIVGVVVGVIEYYLKVDYGTALNFVIAGFPIVLIDNILKIIWRKVLHRNGTDTFVLVRNAVTNSGSAYIFVTPSGANDADALRQHGFYELVNGIFCGKAETANINALASIKGKYELGKPMSIPENTTEFQIRAGVVQ